MGLLRRKPFAFLTCIVAFALLILACLTVQHACYDQLGIMTYSKITQDGWCEAECGDQRAIKKVAFPVNGILVNVENELGFTNVTPNIRRYVRCPWRGTTNRIFLAFASLLCLWLILELTLGAYRKYPFLLNLVLLLVIGFGVPTAAYQMDDLHHTDCDRDVIGQNSPSGSIYSVCYWSLFNVSFILTIVAMVLLLAQFVYNIINRKKINEKDPQYANIPQQSAATEPVQNVPTTDNRIA